MNNDKTTQIITRVLCPISSVEPCGKWSRYSPEFMSLSKSREEDIPNMPMGEWERPLIKADWKKVGEQCINFLEKESKDLQIVIWLCDALVRTQQIYGLSLGLIVINELILNYWETIWPALEKDDVEARVAPFIWLNTSFITRLNQNIILLQPSMSRSNSIYLTDWENSLKSNSDSGVVSREKIRESTTEEDINWLNEIEEQSNNSLVTVKKISMTLDRLLASESPSLFNLKNTIEKISNTSTSLLKKFSIKKLNKDYILEEQKEKKSITKEKLKENNIPKKEPTHGAETLADGLNTKIKDRNQAYAELEKIADFLQKIEPHSPTPYLIYKLLKWKNMTLEELVNDARQEESLNGILAIINSVKTKN